jgi:hypothetical protein
MTSAAPITSLFESKSRLGVIFLLAVLALVLPQVPILGLLAKPLFIFTTTIHECGHAVACLLTGGQVTGMSIMSDGEGHGGLTYCRGGNPFIYTQTGYISTALVGSLLIYLGRFPKLSKAILMLIGVGFAIASLIFMPGAIFAGQGWAAFFSIIAGLAMSAGLIYVSMKSSHYWANVLLLFLGVQTGLNALTDDATLISLGLAPPGTPTPWSDASNMQQLTGGLVPAPIWAGLWTAIALFLLFKALESSVKLERKKQAIKSN